MLRHIIKSQHEALKLTSCDWSALQSLVPLLEQMLALDLNDLVEDLVLGLKQTILTFGSVETVKNEELDNWRDKFSKKQSKSLIREINKCKIDDNNSSVGESNLDISFKKLKRELDEDDDVVDHNEVSSSFPSSSSVYNPMSDPSHDVSNSKQISISSSHNCNDLPASHYSSNDLPASHYSSYKEAMEEIYSPLIPVRGHALLSLSKLLDSRDKEALENKNKLLKLFEHYIKDEDSYIYLMAIEGLAALCDIYPSKIVFLLCQEVNGHRTAADRAKMAEVITRCVRRLHQFLPQFRDNFINSLLTGVGDDDELVRAACLSALGEVCKELRFSISNEIHTILKTVVDVVKADTKVEPRRAAVLLVTLLLRGLGKDTMQFLKEVLKDLYKGLRFLVHHDKDEITRVHAGVAMDEIDAIVKDFLLPKVNMKKKIYITEAPPKFF